MTVHGQLGFRDTVLRAIYQIREDATFDFEHGWRSFGKNINHYLRVNLLDGGSRILAAAKGNIWEFLYQVLSVPSSVGIFVVDPDPFFFLRFPQSC